MMLLMKVVTVSNLHSATVETNGGPGAIAMFPRPGDCWRVFLNSSLPTNVAGWRRMAAVLPQIRGEFALHSSRSYVFAACVHVSNYARARSPLTAHRCSAAAADRIKPPAPSLLRCFGGAPLKGVQRWMTDRTSGDVARFTQSQTMLLFLILIRLISLVSASCH